MIFIGDLYRNGKYINNALTSYNWLYTSWVLDKELYIYNSAIYKDWIKL